MLAAYAAAQDADRPLAGTRVAMWGGSFGADGVVDELAAFQEQTGINVQYSIIEELNAPFVEGTELGELPDVLHLAGPQVRDLAGRGTLGLLGLLGRVGGTWAVCSRPPKVRCRPVRSVVRPRTAGLPSRPRCCRDRS